MAKNEIPKISDFQSLGLCDGFAMVVNKQLHNLGPETSGGFYEYSSLLCLLVTALSFTTTAGSDKLKEFACVGVFSTAITKFN